MNNTVTIYIERDFTGSEYKVGDVVYLDPSLEEISVTVQELVSDCRELNQTNEVYILQNDVSSTGTCFNITAENITLDCNGYEINYSYAGTLGYGIYSEENFTNLKYDGVPVLS